MAQQMQSRKWFWFQNPVPECIRLSRNTLCIPDPIYIGNWRRIWSWYSSGICGSSSLLFLLFRPDPYKSQKVLFKRSVNA